MKKILLCVAMLAMFVVSCGGGKSTKDKDVIKVGVIGPLTGNLAQYGTSSINGFKLKVKEINEAGGINGKKIEVVEADSKGDVQEAINAFKKMVSQDKIDIFVGEVTSGPSLAIAPLAQQAKIPMITSTSTAFDVTKDKDFVFRTTFTDPYQGEVLAKFTKDKLAAKTVAIISNNSSDYSDGVANAFAKEAEAQGIQIVAREGYSDGDKDFKAQLTKIAQQNPDVLFVPDYYEQDGLIAIQAREVGIKSVIVGPDGWDGVVKTVDPSSYAAIEDVFFANHYSTKDSNEKVQNFIKNYKEKYNDEPSAFSALSYDAAYILKAAIEKAGTTDKEAVAKAIKELEFEGITGHLTFDEKNNPVKSITIIKIVNGDYTFDSVVSK